MNAMDFFAGLLGLSLYLLGLGLLLAFVTGAYDGEPPDE